MATPKQTLSYISKTNLQDATLSELFALSASLSDLQNAISAHITVMSDANNGMDITAPAGAGMEYAVVRSKDSTPAVKLIAYSKLSASQKAIAEQNGMTEMSAGRKGSVTLKMRKAR